jgi:hypothetical protein
VKDHATNGLLTVGEVEHYRKDLVLRGGGFAELLVDVLRGKPVNLTSFPLAVKPGERSADRVHRMFGVVDEALHRIELRTYGHCTVCNGRLPRATLAHAPWTERCADCARASRRNAAAAARAATLQ